MRDRKLENYKKEDFDLQLKQLQFIQEISLKVSKFSAVQYSSHSGYIPYRATLCRAKVTNFLKGDENFARRIISPDENFARQTFAQQYNHNLFK